MARTDDSRRTLWIVNHYATPPDRPSGTRHVDLGRRLVAAGMEVTIFAAGVSHVTGHEERLTGRRLVRTGRFDGVRFVWLRTVPYQGNGASRALNILSFTLLFPVVQARFQRPDVVIGSTVHPFAALAAWFVARARRARFVFEIRDLWPQTLVDLGAMGVGSAGERLLRAIEAFLVRHADAVISLLDGVPEYLRERGLPASHVTVIPNGVDLEAFDVMAGADAPEPALAAAGTVVERRHAEGRVVFGYAGIFGRVTDVRTLIRAAAIAEDRSPGRIALLLVGDGPERASIEALAAERRAPVDLLPPVPKAAVPRLLGLIDVGLVHATATPTYRYGISFNKLFEYLAACRPVLFACTSAYDPVAAAGAGVSIEPGDPERMAEAMLELADEGVDGRARMGRAGRGVVERDHDIARLAARLEAVLDGTP